MYHRNMIVGYLATSEISQDEQAVIRGRLGKYAHTDGRIMAACLDDIFLDEQHKSDFIAAWDANPVKFMEMIDTP
jgi:hypothetical protein